MTNSLIRLKTINRSRYFSNSALTWHDYPLTQPAEKLKHENGRPLITKSLCLFSNDICQFDRNGHYIGMCSLSPNLPVTLHTYCTYNREAQQCCEKVRIHATFFGHSLRRERDQAFMLAQRHNISSLTQRAERRRRHRHHHKHTHTHIL